MRSGRSSPDLARRMRVYSDPLQHAALAALVVAPLAVRTDSRVLRTAVAVAMVFDVDHVLAARSARPREMTSLPARPRTHSLPVAVCVGCALWAAAGPWHGWSAFSALGAHLLHDSGDRAAPTPVLWPWRPARQLGRRVQIIGTIALAMVSVAAGRHASRA